MSDVSCAATMTHKSDKLVRCTSHCMSSERLEWLLKCSTQTMPTSESPAAIADRPSDRSPTAAHACVLTAMHPDTTCILQLNTMAVCDVYQHT